MTSHVLPADDLWCRAGPGSTPWNRGPYRTTVDMAFADSSEITILREGIMAEDRVTTATSEGVVTGSRPGIWSRRLMFAPTDAGTWLGTGDDYEIEFVDWTGTTTGHIGWEGPDPAVTQEHLDAHRERLRDSYTGDRFDARWEREREILPASFPAYGKRTARQTTAPSGFGISSGRGNRRSGSPSTRAGSGPTYWSCLPRRPCSTSVPVGRSSATGMPWMSSGLRCTASRSTEGAARDPISSPHGFCPLVGTAACREPADWFCLAWPPATGPPLNRPRTTSGAVSRPPSACRTNRRSPSASPAARRRRNSSKSPAPPVLPTAASSFARALACRVQRFGPDGEHLWSRGKAGEGPGDFRQFAELLVTCFGDSEKKQRPDRVGRLSPRQNPLRKLVEYRNHWIRSVTSDSPSVVSEPAMPIPLALWMNSMPWKLVGASRFERPTSRTPSECAT